MNLSLMAYLFRPKVNLLRHFSKMPPNAQGGKGYRKGKHTSLSEGKMIEWDEEQGQLLGRTMKKLGDRRFRIFCNDNKERICKLAGSMRKSDWVEEGSIVIVGVRELSTCTTSKGDEVADILAIIEMSLYGKLKKMEGVNQLLFSHVETEDKQEMARKIKAQQSGQDVDDDVFDRDVSGESPKDTDEERSEGGEVKLVGIAGEEQRKAQEMARAEKKKTREQAIDTSRSMKRNADVERDVNIDDI